MAMIEFRSVSKWYGSFQVLKNCTTQVENGEVVVVCGPSGSGKSTLIKCVNALEPFQQGELVVNGQAVGAKSTNLPQLRAKIGMVFQNFELFPHMSVTQYNLTEIGYKYHMNDYSAALGLGNLEGFEDRDARVRLIAGHYNKFLGEWAVQKKEGCSYWLYDLLVERREDFMRAMGDRGIPTSVVHVGIDRSDIFEKYELPIQRRWDKHHVCIPIHAGLTDDDAEKVVKGVLKGW